MSENMMDRITFAWIWIAMGAGFVRIFLSDSRMWFGIFMGASLMMAAIFYFTRPSK